MAKTYRKRSRRSSRKRRCKHGRLRNPYKSKKSGKYRVCKKGKKKSMKKRKCKRGQTRDKKTKRCRKKRKSGRMSKKAKSKRARANWKRLSRKAKNVGMADSAFTQALL